MAIHETAHKSTSPIIFDEASDASSSDKIVKELVKSNTPKIFVEKAVSPINSYVYMENTQYSANITSNEIATSPIFFSDAAVTNDERNNYTKSKDKECLETNSANNISEENTDREIESILNTMRIHHRLITPIPITPKPTLVDESHACIVPDSLNTRTHCGCSKVPQILESQKNLQATVANLVKYVKLIAMNQQPKDGFVEKEFLMDIQDGEDNPPNNNHFSSREESEEKEKRNRIIQEDEVTENENLHILSQEETFSSSQQFENVVETIENNIDKTVNIESDTKSCGKILRVKKLTKLEKLRKKLLPKRKIKCVTPPPTKQIRTRSQNIAPGKKNESISLNNKVAYDKAVEIMAEIKLKQNAKSKCLKEPTQKKTKSTEMFCENLSNESTASLTSLNNSITTRSRSIQICDKNPTVFLTSINTPSPGMKIELNITDKDQSTQLLECKHIADKSPDENEKDVSIIVSDNTLLHEGKRRSIRLSLDTQEALSKSQNENDDSAITSRKAKKVCGSEKESRKVSKRVSSDVPETETKRVLRSSTVSQPNVDDDDDDDDVSLAEICFPSVDSYKIENNNNINQSLTLYDPSKDVLSKIDDHSKIVNYNDMNLFVDEPVPYKKPKMHEKNKTTGKYDPRQSLLCIMLEKYGVSSVKNCNRKMSGE